MNREDPVSETGSLEELPQFQICTNSGITVKLGFLDNVSFMAEPAVNHTIVKLGRRGGSRWSSSDIWDQNANIWAVMRNSSGLKRWFLKGDGASFVF